MPPSPFQYAIVRVVPQVERGECVNAGVVLFCRPLRFLAARVALDAARAARARAGRRPRRRPRPPRRARPDRGRRPGRRPDRRAAGVRALPLARRAVEHDHPVLAGAHGPERGPGRRARAPGGAAGALGSIRSGTLRSERTPLPRYLLALLIGLLALGGAACGSDDDEEPAAARPTATAEAADACAPDQLALIAAGTLTVGTDKPAYPPYFEDDDPTNGKGFESAVAYAVAERARLRRDKVEWTVVPFNSSYAPGPKKFDFDINQISITPKRAERVDFSTPYYTAPQAVVALKSSAGRVGDVAGRARGRQARRAGRHDEPRRGHRGDQAVEPAAGVQRLQRHGARAQDQARRRDRRRPADRVLPDRGGDPGGEDHRPVRRAGRRRLGRRAREGLRADAVRGPGARGARRARASSSRSPTSGWAARPARPSCNSRRRFPSRPRAASPARRRAARARAARRAVSAVSTVVVLGLLVARRRDERGLAERARDVLLARRTSPTRSRPCSTASGSTSSCSWSSRSPCSCSAWSSRSRASRARRRCSRCGCCRRSSSTSSAASRRSSSST